MPSIDPTFARRFLLVSSSAGIILAAIFSSFPGIDLTISEALRHVCGGDARHSGWCHENGILMLPRWLAIAATGLFAAIAAALLLVPVRDRRRRDFDRPRALFLLAVFALGPGVLANVALKDNWGRARPREVVELGGERRFTPPLVPSQECHDNCSFVSGESSAVYAAFFAAALVVPQMQMALVGCGIAAGTLTGLVRMSTGGHFLSDVLFSGVFMALTACLLHMLFFNLWTRIARSIASRAREFSWPTGPGPATPRPQEVQ